MKRSQKCWWMQGNTALSVLGYVCSLLTLLQKHATVKTETISVNLYLLFQVHCHMLAAQGCHSSHGLSSVLNAECCSRGIGRLTGQGIVVGNERLFALLVGGLVGLFQVLPALLGNLGLLEGISKGSHRNVLVLVLAFVVLLHSRKHIRGLRSC